MPSAMAAGVSAFLFGFAFAFGSASGSAAFAASAFAAAALVLLALRFCDEDNARCWDAASASDRVGDADLAACASFASLRSFG